MKKKTEVKESAPVNSQKSDVFVLDTCILSEISPPAILISSGLFEDLSLVCDDPVEIITPSVSTNVSASDEEVTASLT